MLDTILGKNQARVLLSQNHILRQRWLSSIINMIATFLIIKIKLIIKNKQTTFVKRSKIINQIKIINKILKKVKGTSPK